MYYEFFLLGPLMPLNGFQNIIDFHSHKTQEKLLDHPFYLMVTSLVHIAVSGYKNCTNFDLSTVYLVNCLHQMTKIPIVLHQQVC